MQPPCPSGKNILHFSRKNETGVEKKDGFWKETKSEFVHRPGGGGGAEPLTKSRNSKSNQGSTSLLGVRPTSI